MVPFAFHRSTFSMPNTLDCSMQKRKLRIVKQSPAIGVCERCNAQFKGANIEAQFDAISANFWTVARMPCGSSASPRKASSRFNGRTMEDRKGFSPWQKLVRTTLSTKPTNPKPSRFTTPTINVALDAIYPKTNGVPALVDTVTATIASLSDISSLAPSCANPLVTGRSSPTKGRGEHYPECPTPYEAFAQEGYFPVQRKPLSILPSLYPQNALLVLETNDPCRLHRIQMFPLRSLLA